MFAMLLVLVLVGGPIAYLAGAFVAALTSPGLGVLTGALVFLGALGVANKAREEAEIRAHARRSG